MRRAVALDAERVSLGEIEAVHRAGLSDFRRVARAVLGSEEAARDAVQDGFVGAIRDRRAYRGAAASEVLYMDFFDRRSGCCRVLSSGEVRLWVDGANPRHFRTVFPGFPEGSPLAEGGGTVEGSLFRYDPSANVLERLRTGVDVSATSFDPVATVCDALAAGRARVTGDAVVDGRRVTRIELTAALSVRARLRERHLQGERPLRRLPLPAGDEREPQARGHPRDASDRSSRTVAGSGTSPSGPTR